MSDMIINAANTSFASGLQNGAKTLLPDRITQEEAEKCKKIFELAHPKSNIEYSAEELAMAPMGKRTDTLEIQGGGLRNIPMSEVKFGYGWDTDYDKERAVKNTWVNSQNTIFRLIGNSGRVSDEAVVGMDIGDFEEYMKTHELDKDIDWHAAGDLIGGMHEVADIEQYSDYAAALCASLEQRIMTDFSGDEQKAQLEKLDEVFEKAVSGIKNSFGETPVMSMEVYDILGAELPEGKLEDSIRALLTEKRRTYRAYIAENEDYAGIKNTDDKWLERDIGYMANALRDAYQPELSDKKTGDLWSEDELVAIGLASELYERARYDSMLAVCGYNDEERIGMDLAVTWLSGEKLKETYNVGDEVSGIFDKLFDGYAKLYANAKDSWMTKLRNDPLNDPTKYTPIEKNSIYAVVDFMKQSYAESGDAQKAIIDTAKFAHDEYEKKVGNTTAKRYSEGGASSEYWKNLYNGGIKEVYKNFGKLTEVKYTRTPINTAVSGRGTVSITQNSRSGGRA